MGERSDVFVFLGPTLPVQEARAVLNVTYLPPAQRGDVLALLHEHPAVIGIVDGYFESVPSVWHKEILRAMASGVHVFGAASMGALRAAELQSFGMVGIGQVYEWYRTGAIDADDEVAVLHAPAESAYRNFSVAMVDVRDACAAALDAGVISSELAGTVLSVAEGMFYADRTYSAILAAAKKSTEGRGGVDGLSQFLAEYGPGLKRRDALDLLRHVGRFVERDPAPLVVDYHVEQTVFLERLEQEVDQVRAAATGILRSDPDAVADGGDSLAVLEKKVLFRLLARWTGARLGFTVSDEEMQVAVNDFRRSFGLLRRVDVEEWARDAGVSNDVFLEVIRDGALVEKLSRHYAHQIGANVPAQMRMETASPWAERRSGGEPP